MNIQPVVEGYGDVEAVPVLLRRLIGEAQASMGVRNSIRRTRFQLVDEMELSKSVRIAMNQPDCSAVLVLFDGDDDCPAELGPRLQRIASAAAHGTPCELVISHREYEAWFLAAIDSLRSHTMIRDDAEVLEYPEGPRDAKGRFEAMMRAGISYSERVDQPKFSAQFDLPAAYARSRSFRKLTKSTGSLLRACGHEIRVWPPAAWPGS